LFLEGKNPFNVSFSDLWHGGMYFEIITANVKKEVPDAATKRND
jgi:hypothetical protein